MRDARATRSIIQASILLTASLLMLAGCVTKGVPVTEKYYDTETRKEPYQTTEQYENRTPLSTEIYQIDCTKENSALLLNTLDTSTIRWARMTLGTDFPQISKIHLESVETNPRIRVVVEGCPLVKSQFKKYVDGQLVDVYDRETCGVCLYSGYRKSSDYKLLEVDQNSFTRRVQYAFPNIGLQTIDDALLMEALGIQGPPKCTEGPCTVEFPISELFSSSSWALIWIYSGPSTAEYVWDNVTVGTREVTKYRDVPYQVEKERTVTKSVAVPFWEAVFSK